MPDLTQNEIDRIDTTIGAIEIGGIGTAVEFYNPNISDPVLTVNGILIADNIQSPTIDNMKKTIGELREKNEKLEYEIKEIKTLLYDDEIKKKVEKIKSSNSKYNRINCG
jgi:FtsZ-binding cell division protein ZapB